MSIFVIALVAAAGVSLVLLGKRLRAKRESFTGFQIRYQSITFLMAMAVLLVTGLAGTWVALLGDLNAPVQGFGYLGATSSDRWISFGTTFFVLMSVVTVVVVWLQSGRGKGIKVSALMSVLPLAALFSVFNALTEELIFRVALIQGLGSSMESWFIALISAILFGALHYLGMPGKIPGVLMAGFMGWLLTFSVIQTGGIFWAWAIHFIQDVIILTIAFAVEKSKRSE